MNEIVFASNNPHKLEEVRKIGGDRLRILSLSDIGCHDDIPETADTFAGNALIKARWVKSRYGYDCFADDTGLCVDALGGAPGVYSARYAGPECDSEANIDKLLHSLEGRGDRKARFITDIALCLGDTEHVFQGRVEGTIATARTGAGGFGYDPVFFVPEKKKTFAQLTPEEKNAISHLSLIHI